MAVRNVVIFSGGMDSYTLLHDVYNRRMGDVVAVSFDYGQRHVKELTYAAAACQEMGIQHIVVPMAFLADLLPGSSQTDPAVDVPEGHYTQANMSLTVVPGRNTIMLSIAMGIAEALANQGGKPIKLYFGAHAGDHTIYPDCRDDYVVSLRETMAYATEGKVDLRAPYINKTKGDIAAIGKAMCLDYSKTWTCYKGQELPCGVCGACNERAEAMQFAGITE
jgi:7-cyano-7-deazaguanine synthase